MKTREEILRIGGLVVDKEDHVGGGCGRFYGLDPRKPTRYAFVVWSIEGGWDHVSVSYKDRCPTWDEMCRVKDAFFDEDECCVEYHPKKEDYVNVMPTCLHIWKPTTVELPTPPKIFV